LPNDFWEPPLPGGLGGPEFKSRHSDQQNQGVSQFCCFPKIRFGSTWEAAPPDRASGALVSAALPPAHDGMTNENTREQKPEGGSGHTGAGPRKLFRFNGHDVGRTYASATPAGARWYWSMYGINLRGPIPEGVVLQGLADDLTVAKAAFKANWQKLLAAGTVQR
jgi:hypothetical protein